MRFNSAVRFSIDKIVVAYQAPRLHLTFTILNAYDHEVGKSS